MEITPLKYLYHQFNVQLVDTNLNLNGRKMIVGKSKLSTKNIATNKTVNNDSKFGYELGKTGPAQLVLLYLQLLGHTWKKPIYWSLSCSSLIVRNHLAPLN
jgi:hypothetical protein